MWEGGADEHIDCSRSDSSPPRRPLLLGLADRCNDGQPDGNVLHAALPYVPPVVVQIGAAAVPPVVLLAPVHGIAVAVRAGASGTVYRWAVSAVAIIGTVRSPSASWHCAT